MAKQTYTARDAAARYDITTVRINEIARARKLGRIEGNRRVFTMAELRQLKPGKRGRPRKGT